MNNHNCINCCIKHLSSACVIAKEIYTGYNSAQYRIYLIGNLNEAQEQIASLDAEMSSKIRDLRLHIAPIGIAFSMLPDDAFVKEIENTIIEISDREEAGKYNKCTGSIYKNDRVVSPVDIIIPVNSRDSKHNNDELRYALRSIERHLHDYRDIYVVSSSDLPEFTNIKHIKINDIHKRKQMNIHDAIKCALNTEGIASNVIFWADDNIIVKDTNATMFPVVIKNGSLYIYKDNEQGNVWKESVTATGTALITKGRGMLNFESHTPVPFNKQKYLDLEKEYDFYHGVGLCYISLYLNHYGVMPEYEMHRVKKTYEYVERASIMDIKDRLFIGYNDVGYEAGLKDLLATLFPAKSKYEV